MKALLITAVALTLLGIGSAGRAEVEQVYFLHKTKTKYVLKLDVTIHTPSHILTPRTKNQVVTIEMVESY